jgi:uncharacterized protein
MKIDINKIPAEGLVLEENIPVSELELDTDVVKFNGSINAKAQVTRITNAITVDLELSGVMVMFCSRCLEEFSLDLDKKLQFNYSADDRQSMLDINPDIREEIILDCPVKPLCSSNCKGLCPKCGVNLNEGGCSCAIT